jgi:DNA-binding transcriptional MerR regulator
MKTNNTLLIGDIMKINEIETLLGFSRANIRFYEKEGLLNPTRNGDGYREYTEEDIVILKKIIIFRKLGLSLPDIKDILTENLDLSIAMEKNIQSLTEQIESLNGAFEIINALKMNATTNETFDE